MRLTQLAMSLIILGLSTNSFALLCPGNFNQINVGDTIDAVKAACGKPVGEKSTDSTAQGPQEWNYYVSVNPAFTQNVSQNTTASLKTTVAFDKGKVTNMSVNGVGVSNTAVCGGTIQVGDTEDTVKAACGKPAFINRGTGSQEGTEDPNAAKTKTTELTYMSAGNTITFVFENGLFTERK
jgi:hypothetical protein